MDKDAIIKLIKENLRLMTDDHDLMISDMVQEACSYCNIPPDDIPEELEPFIRKKAKGILDYEAFYGSGFQPEVSSIKEGDGSISWAQTEGNTRTSIYGLSEADRWVLRRHRRLRGYD